MAGKLTVQELKEKISTFIEEQGLDSDDEVPVELLADLQEMLEDIDVSE